LLSINRLTGLPFFYYYVVAEQRQKGRKEEKIMEKRQDKSLFIITEQACCFAKAQEVESENYRIFQTAAEYLTKGSSELMANFQERINAVKHDMAGSDAYEVAEYENQEIDASNAVAKLLYLSHTNGMAENTKADLVKAAEIISDFYELSNFMEAIPA